MSHTIKRNGWSWVESCLQFVHSVTFLKQADGTALPSMTSKLIDRNTVEDGTVNYETTIIKTTGICLAGATDCYYFVFRIVYIWSLLSAGGDTVCLIMYADPHQRRWPVHHLSDRLRHAYIFPCYGLASRCNAERPGWTWQSTRKRQSANVWR